MHDDEYERAAASIHILLADLLDRRPLTDFVTVDFTENAARPFRFNREVLSAALFEVLEDLLIDYLQTSYAENRTDGTQSLPQDISVD